jgi:hypothetical protein
MWINRGRHESLAEAALGDRTEWAEPAEGAPRKARIRIFQYRANFKMSKWVLAVLDCMGRADKLQKAAQAVRPEHLSEQWNAA